MSDPFIGEVRMFGGNFAPVNWALCDGRLQNISQNTALFSLLGTTYGGDGVQTFALPDLRGRVPIHQGTGAGLSTRVIGELAGTETVALNASTMPQHSHSLNASSNPGSQPGPSNGVPATPTNGVSPFLYVVPGSSQVNPSPMRANSIGSTGSSVPHDNMMPTLCVTFIICLFGIFPSRN